MNPLNVPVKITNVSAVAKLPQTLKYHVNYVKWVEEYDCEASVFAQLSIGPGIVQGHDEITWVDVPKNAKATYFAIADPPKGSKPETCHVIYDFSCCFATLTAAYACYLNPGIQSNTYSGELTTAYMPFELDANITMLIDNAFEVNTTYYQPWFPVYFGWEVYGGYITDLKLSCSDYTFKD